MSATYFNTHYNMYLTKELLIVSLIVLVLPNVFALFFHTSESAVTGVRKSPRWNIPWLGIGLWCNGCPPRGCEDDEAIIHGFCCGCARSLDKLPVLCPEFLQCPLNLHGLCHDYEYMLRCCC